MDIGYSGSVFTNDHSIYFLPPWLTPVVLFPASVLAFPTAAPDGIMASCVSRACCTVASCIILSYRMLYNTNG